MKAQETALVLIEFQNEFCKEGGKLNPGVNGEIARQGTIDNAVKLSQGAREKGAVVIHAPFIFNPAYYDEHQMVGIVKAVADAEAFQADSWGSEIIDELKPAESDRVVGGKCTLCGFNNTDLGEILKNTGVKNVVTAGFLTNFCVESTSRTAYDRGYSVTIIKDATAATSPEEQEHAEAKIFPAIGHEMTTDEFLAQLD